MKPGRVVLVGAGPGDPDLLTVRAARELGQAEVLLYDALIDPAILELAAPGCQRIDVGKRGDGSRGIPQDRIAEVMIQKAREGRYVVRLKGGDSFVFGRGGEEASALVAAGIPFEVVPGVTSAVAVPAYAGIPVTDRRLSSSVAIVTGHRGKQVEDRRVAWEALGRSAETLVVMMGTAWLDDIVRRLIDGGRDPETPAAVIASGTTPRQRVVTAPLRELPERVRASGLHAPTVVVVGEVVRFRETLAWFERRPLFGRRVLVTRSEEQAPGLLGLLRRRGAAPICVPLLEFEPPADRAPLEQALARLASFDWIVFSSANAVRFSEPALRAHFGARAAPARPRVGCIGAATAEAARALGLPVDAVPRGRASPETMLAEMARAGPLSGTRVLFPRAERAGPALRKLLETAGAEVEDPVAYRTLLPSEAPAALRKAIEEGLDAVVFTSPSSVLHLVQSVGEGELRELASRALLCSIGPTTAAALREWGLEPAVVSERQTGDDLVQALELALAQPAEPADGIS